MSVIKWSEENILKKWEWFLRKNRSFTRRLLGMLLISALSILASHFLYLVSPLYLSAILLLADVAMILYGDFLLGMPFTLILCGIIDYYFVPPYKTLFVYDSDAGLNFIVITLISIFIGITLSSFRFALERSDHLKQVAEKAVAARDEMVGRISHELKNPLMSLETGITLVEKIFPKDSELAINHIRRLRSAIKRMNLLICDLIDVTRIESHELVLEMIECDLSELTRDVVRSFELLFQEKAIELENKITSGELSVVCDSARTTQVLANLINNALKFTKPGGKVTVSAKPEGEWIEVLVSDTGKGIRKKHYPHLFDRFWQEKDAAYKGTGLGLAISQGLVEAQGGKMWVESETDVGSRFYFTLPRAIKSSLAGAVKERSR